MTTIWKWSLTLSDDQELEMPAGAIPLCVQTQGAYPQLWARVDPKAPLESRRVRTYGTGHNIYDDPGTYVGTWQTAGGAFIWHVFVS